MDEEMSKKDKVIAWFGVAVVGGIFLIFAYAVLFLPPGWYLKYLI